MKRVLMSLLVLAFTVAGVWAQKNTVLVYGSVGATSEKLASGSQASTFSLSPAVGYQFTDTWTAGLSFSTQTWTAKALGTETKSSAFGLGPFVRYTHPLSALFVLFGQFNADVLTGKTGDFKTTGYRGTFFPAIGVIIKNGFALNLSFGGLSFLSQKANGASGNTTNFSVNLGSGAGFGISKNF
ncbi:outer membrane beta-barrel protein [Larkinella ripae]